MQRPEAPKWEVMNLQEGRGAAQPQPPGATALRTGHAEGEAEVAEEEDGAAEDEGEEVEDEAPGDIPAAAVAE